MLTNKEICRAYYQRNKEKSRIRSKAYYDKITLESPWRRSMVAAKTRAKKEGLTFNLTEEWASSRFTGSCELTGIAFDFNDKFYTASIDKVDPKLGYTQDNCRFILFCVNMFKWSKVGDEDIRKVAAKILKPFKVKPKVYNTSETSVDVLVNLVNDI